MIDNDRALVLGIRYKWELSGGVHLNCLGMVRRIARSSNELITLLQHVAASSTQATRHFRSSINLAERTQQRRIQAKIRAFKPTPKPLPRLLMCLALMGWRS